MCTVNGCDRPRKAKGLCAMHYQRWRRTGDPEKVRRAGRPRDDMLDDLRERFTGTWSPRTITRYKRVERLCAALAVDESGEVSPSEYVKQLDELDWATNFGNLKKNVAGMERMALAKLRAEQAGCTEEEWADLKLTAQDPERRFEGLAVRRVNVARLKRLLLTKLEDMVDQGRVEKVHREGRILYIESGKH